MSYNSEVYFKGTLNGSSEIYYDNSKKWDTTKRELNKHIMNMARYITEGIIDAID